MITESTVEPVRRVVTVRRDSDEAFRLFTEDIGKWWPLGSAGEQRPEGIVLEPRRDGLIYERLTGGEIAPWGRVLAWEPPHRLVLEWQPNPSADAPTEIEVRFIPEETGTRVELEHRGWQRLGDRGSLARMEYDLGWDGVLGRFAAAGDHNSPAIVSFVLGIVSLVVPFAGLLAGPVGAAFGTFGVRRARRGGRYGGLATAGITLSVVGFVVWLLVVLLVFAGGGSSSSEIHPVRVPPPARRP